MDSCASLGSPTPCRMNPSKSNNGVPLPLIVFMLFLLLNKLKTSTFDNLEPFSQVKWSCRPEVKRKIGVVLAKEISSAVNVRSAWAEANLHPMPSFCIATERPRANSITISSGHIGIGAIGLRRVGLHSNVKAHLPRQFGVCDKIEFMLFVAVGVGIFLRKIVKIIVVEAERISFVGIIVQIFRPHIIRIQLE